MSESNQPNSISVSGDGLLENNVSGSSDPSPSGCVLSQTADTRGRKRKREPHKGKSNIRKQRCNSGQDFINKHGVHRPASMMKKACGHKCRYKYSSTLCNT